jgi:plasmid stability protein
MARKRAPGGGRKPGPNTPRAQLTIRMPDDLRAELEATAAKHGHTLTQEMLRRLRVSLREDARDPATRSLCYLLSVTANQAGADRIPRRRGQPKKPWTHDPFVFKAFRLAFDKLLGAHQPSGELRPPWGDASEPFDTPESTADFAVRYLLVVLMAGAPLITPDGTKPELANEIALDAYDLLQARQGLKVPNLNAVLAALGKHTETGE